MIVDPADQSEMEVSQIESEYQSIESQIDELQKRIKKYQSNAIGYKENGNPEMLSNTLIRLARVNSALGSKAAFAKYVARNADRAYRRCREQSKLDYIDTGMAIGKAESKGYLAAGDVFKIYSDSQLLADTAEDMAYRTDTFLKMSQSGLSLIKQDIQGRP